MTTPMIDPDLEERLRARLHEMADGAPTGDVDAVLGIALVGRSRSRAWMAPLVGAAAAAAAVIGGLAVTAHHAPSTEPEHTAAIGPHLPPIPHGWRWEAYRDVAVAVPDSWGYETAGMPYCALTDAPHRTTVGRPGAIPFVVCPKETSATLVDIAGTYVDLHPARDLRYHVPALGDGDTSGDRTVRVVGETAVEVQARQPLRDQILATVTPLPEAGVHGCRAQRALATDLGWRPSSGPIPEPSAVTRIAVCTYDTNGSGLRAASLLPDDAIARTVSALRSAPVGGTPDRTRGCGSGPGDEITVVRMATADGVREVVLRYSGCADRGMDDGTTVRALARPALADVLVGPHRPMAISGDISEVMPDLPSP